MSQSDSETLSAEQLRNRLYHSLRDKGLVDALKTQLRNRLVSELKQIGVSQEFTPQTVHTHEGSSLLLRASNSLVADHLRRCHYEYSLSVFLPESGIETDKIFTPRDLLQLLNISPQSSLHKHLTAHAGYHKNGFLWQLLCEIASQHGSAAREASVQTDQMGVPPASSLNAKFEEVDRYFSDIGQDTKARSVAVEERILCYQRQLEERFRNELALEKARFKETELAAMRAEERETCRQEIEKRRKEMERTYRVKHDALVERERNAADRLQQQQSISERETFAQRQSILEEIEVVRQRETELRRAAEINEREKQVLDERVKTREQAARAREDAARKSELEYEARLQDQVTRVKLEEQSRYMQRFKDLEWREMKVKEDERRLSEELHDIKMVKDELRDKRIRCNTMEADLEKLKRDVLNYQCTNEQLSARVKDMVDYQMLKDENLLLKKDLDLVKGRLLETQKELQTERNKHEALLHELGERMAKPAPEALYLQRELDKSRAALRQEHLVAEHERQQLQMAITEERERTRDVMRRFEEQSMQHKDMNRELRDTRHVLNDTRHALNNEVYNHPKMAFSGVERVPLHLGNSYPPRHALHGTGLHNTHFHSVYKSRSPSLCDLLDLEEATPTRPSTHRDSSVRPDLHPSSHSEPDLLLSKDDDDATHGGGVSHSEDYSYSSDIVVETKRRLRSLEQEAENLQQNYVIFQQRLTNVSSLPDTRAPMPMPAARTPPEAIIRNTGTSRSRLEMSQGRPLSSTPHKMAPVSHTSLITPPSHSQPMGLTDQPPMDISVSTVHSPPITPPKYDGRNTGSVQNRAITMDDLEARPGSPSVMVLEGSRSPPSSSAGKPETAGTRRTPTGQDISEKTAPSVVSLEQAWKQPSALPSLDSAWKTQESAEDKRRREEEEKRKQEEEDRAYEERRRQREEERRRKQEEDWAREQEQLKRLTSGEPYKPPEPEPVKPAEPEKKQPDIDPVMAKYMEMVAKQRTEKKDAPASSSKGKKDTTPSASEADVSDDKSAAGGFGSDDDFQW